MSYAEFLSHKRMTVPMTGKDVMPDAIHPKLFPFQADLTRWAVRKGRSALFADTGLGKTFMQLAWANLMDVPTLIVAPLAVTGQTIGEAHKLGMEDIAYARRQSDVRTQITVTNYEMVEAFDPAQFEAVVLDESSILKAIDGKTRAALTDMFARTPYRLCCTATPAPNDIAEIANHAEFLGIMTRADMLATFFVHDDEGWRLKRHAEVPFYRWLASWGMSIKKPSDLGYPDDGYILPPLAVLPHFVDTGYHREGMLFQVGLDGIQDRIAVRKATLPERVRATWELAQQPGQWIVWHGLNEEGRMLHAMLPDSELVEGNQSPDEKTAAIQAFQDGRHRVLITKAKIAGFGLNFQMCHQMAFLGLSDSWEAYYQCIRRCWRFGQTQPVQVHIVLSEAEREVYENVMQKEAEANRMSESLTAHMREFERTEITEAHADYQYATGEATGEGYRLLMGDCVERLAEVGPESVDLSVFSPPFLSLYTYSPTERDIGNSQTESDFYQHFGYVADHLLRVTKPGRNCCVHVSQVPAMLVRDGYIGMKDFRGGVIRLFQEHGWIYHGEVCIDKDPQAQAIRIKTKSLAFSQLHKDSSWLRPALADYIVVFRKPGENAVPIRPDITNDEWIEWARPIWYGIRESATLNAAEGRDKDDERHIAPLQLETIERCIRLWSNTGETVLSPFAGIGSEGYVALKHERKFVGIELKPSYFSAARKNLQRAVESNKVHQAAMPL